MNDIRFPEGFRLERLEREQRRTDFHSGERAVDDWLATKALQNQNKRLSTSKVLINSEGAIAGYYTLASAQVDFGDLPVEVSKRLPRRLLPVAVLAWLGVDERFQGQGLGDLLMAQALRDAWEAGKTFPFVAVVLDCINESAKEFYRRWDFSEMPGQGLRLFLSARNLDAMMHSS